MNIKKYSQTPFLYENKESNTMVIFIHGILEGPKQFRKFTEVVYNKGFSYSAILLDGHGGSGKKFANSSMKKWINSVEKDKFLHDGSALDVNRGITYIMLSDDNNCTNGWMILLIDNLNFL